MWQVTVVISCCRSAERFLPFPVAHGAGQTRLDTFASNTHGIAAVSLSFAQITGSKGGCLLLISRQIYRKHNLLSTVSGTMGLVSELWALKR